MEPETTQNTSENDLLEQQKRQQTNDILQVNEQIGYRYDSSVIGNI